MTEGKRSTLWVLVALWAITGIVGPAPSLAQEGPPAVYSTLNRLQPDTAEPPLVGGAAAPRAGDVVVPPLAPLGAEGSDALTPTVSIQVGVPALANAGQELEYRIVVENRSRAAAHHVKVTDKVDNATFLKATPEPNPDLKKADPNLTWNLGTMAGSTRKEILLVVKPTGAGDIDNIARVEFEHGLRTKTALSRPQLRVREVGPTQGSLKEVLKFQLEVTNVGSADATDVLLTDTLPDGLAFSDSQPGTPGGNPLTWTIGTIAPGQTRRVSYQVIADKAGTWTTQIRATAKGIAQPADGSTTITVGDPKMTVIVTGPARRLVNRAAVYQIIVANPGTIALTGVRVVDKIPADITFLSASAGGRRVGDQVQWDVGTIPSGSRKLMQMVVRSAKPGEFTNVATTSAEHNQEARDAVLTTFETPKTLAIEIEKAADPVDAGQDALYTIRLINPTNAPAANVGLTVIVPDELKINETEIRGPTAGTVNQQTIKFGLLPGLAAGQETVYSIPTKALNPGSARLKVELTSDTLPAASVVTQEENLTVLQSK